MFNSRPHKQNITPFDECSPNSFPFVMNNEWERDALRKKKAHSRCHSGVCIVAEANNSSLITNHTPYFSVILMLSKSAHVPFYLSPVPIPLPLSIWKNLMRYNTDHTSLYSSSRACLSSTVLSDITEAFCLLTAGIICIPANKYNKSKSYTRTRTEQRAW